MKDFDAPDSGPMLTHFDAGTDQALCEGRETILQSHANQGVRGFTTRRGFVTCPDCNELLRAQGSESGR